MTTSPHAGRSTGWRLPCFGEAELPPEAAVGLADLLRWPEQAKARLWEILAPALPEPPAKDLDAAIDAFRGAHELPRDRLWRALSACRFVLREAARRNVSSGELEAALMTLPEGAELLVMLGPGTAGALQALRQEILAATVADHGKLLVGLTWRVDSMLLSQRGEQLQSPVALVTLRYLEGGEQHRITLQALPDMLQQLRAMCAELLK